VLADELFKYRALWDVPKREPVGPRAEEHDLGFLKRSELAQVTLDAALTDVVAPLSEIGITLTEAEFTRIFGAGVERPIAS
jgi:hypothetical protein